MWLNEYFLNSWHHNCETSMKMYWKSSEKFRKCKEKFKCSCNLCVTKVDNNLEITSVRSSLDSGNKIWIGKPFTDIVFHFKNTRLGFSFFTTRKLGNYLVQVFLVGFSSFLLSDYTSLTTNTLRKRKPATLWMKGLNYIDWNFLRKIPTKIILIWR